MKISSKLHPQPSSTNFLVLDVKAGLKLFFAGLMVGRLENGEPLLSEVGQQCLNALISAQDLFSNNKDVLFVEVATEENALARVLGAANRTPRHGAVAFLCHDSKVYDAVFAQLGFKGK